MRPDVSRWHQGLVPAVVGVLLGWLVAVSPLGRQIDRWLNDGLARMAAPAIDTSGTLVVAIDDEALLELQPLAGAWPFQRDVWAHVLDYLREAGAATTVIDVVFAEPRRGDEQLRQALLRNPRTILAAVLSPGPTPADSTRAPLAAAGWPIPEALPASAWEAATPPEASLLMPGGVGVANVVPDADGVIRRLALFHRVGDARLPALPLAALHDGTSPVTWEPAGSGGRIRLGDRSFEVGKAGDVELWYPPTLPRLPAVSFGRLARAALTSEPDPELQATIRGRQVFVGATAVLLGDSLLTPRGRVNGVMFVAMAEALLRHDHTLRPVSRAWNLLLLLGAILIALRSARQGRRAPGWLVLAVPLVVVALGLAALGLLVAAGQPVSLVLPLVAATGVVGTVGMQEVLRLRRDRQRLEAERLATERAVEQKTRFLNHVAHELRTPVAAIVGFSRLLAQEGTPPDQALGYAGTIARNAAHMLQLINNLLADARLSIGRARSEPHPTSIRQVLRDVVATLDGLPRSERVSLEVDVDPATPDRLFVDDLRVRQILLNLLGNAVKFTQVGRIALTTSWAAGQLVVHVDDTGPGIPPEAHEAIFQEFEIGSPQAERAGGSGLGLSVSRRLARLMGGDLTLTSTPGQGSRFTVVLPARIVSPDKADEAPSTLTAAAALVSTPEAGAPPTSEDRAAAPPLVLVCDDAPDIRYLFEVVLQQAGTLVMTAADGPPAVALAVSERPSLVLLDIDMPSMSGLEAFAQMRASGYAGPVVAVTGAGDDQTSALLLARGFADVVHKPMPMSRLLDVVETHVPGWKRPARTYR